MNREGLKLTAKLTRLGMSSADAVELAGDAIGKADNICGGRKYSRLERWALLQYLCYPAWSGLDPQTVELPAVRLRQALPVDANTRAFMATLRRPLKLEVTGDGITIGAVCGINLLASVNEWSRCKGSETLNALLFQRTEYGDDAILLRGQAVFEQVIPAGRLIYLAADHVGKYVNYNHSFV